MTTLTETFSNIADAIRNKNGSSDTYTPAQMPTAINAIPTGSTINNQNKTISPTESQQQITADSGYTGLGIVTVNAISNTYIGSAIEQRDDSDLSTEGATITVPEGYYENQVSKTVASGSYGAQSQSRNKNTSAGLMQYTVRYPSFIAGYISAAPSATFNSTLESKTATPSESSQTITPTGNNYYLEEVTVEAIPSTYIGSEVTRRDDTDLSVNGATVTVPSGYYTDNETKTVATTTHSNPTASINSTNGLITASHTQTAGYVNAGTTTGTLQLSTQAGATITPTKNSQTAVAAGKYTLGAINVAAIPANYITTTDATATAADIVDGETAYVNGSKLTGTLVINKYYTGSVAPSASLGSNGDIYIQE